MILAATQQLETHMARAARPVAQRLRRPLAGTLLGQRLGVIGLGEIGGRVARVGKAFGMDVVTWSPRMTPERAAAQGVGFVPLEELLATSQVVSLHLVVTPATRHLLNAERLALMQPGSLLVNTSRSELIDTAALVPALKQGRPGFAALDVFDVEPLPLDDPLRGLPNVLLTRTWALSPSRCSSASPRVSRNACRPGWPASRWCGCWRRELNRPADRRQSAGTAPARLPARRRFPGRSPRAAANCSCRPGRRLSARRCSGWPCRGRSGRHRHTRASDIGAGASDDIGPSGPPETMVQ